MVVTDPALIRLVYVSCSIQVEFFYTRSVWSPDAIFDIWIRRLLVQRNNKT